MADVVRFDIRISLINYWDQREHAGMTDINDQGQRETCRYDWFQWSGSEEDMQAWLISMIRIRGKQTDINDQDQREVGTKALWSLFHPWHKSWIYKPGSGYFHRFASILVHSEHLSSFPPHFLLTIIFTNHLPLPSLWQSSLSFIIALVKFHSLQYQDFLDSPSFLTKPCALHQYIFCGLSYTAVDASVILHIALKAWSFTL